MCDGGVCVSVMEVCVCVCHIVCERVCVSACMCICKKGEGGRGGTQSCVRDMWTEGKRGGAIGTEQEEEEGGIV